MTGGARWSKGQVLERPGAGGTGSTSPAVGGGAPVLQALAWSIAVVLVGGVLAMFTTRGLPGQTVLQQGAGSAVPVDHAGPVASGDAVAPSGEARPQAAVADPAATAGTTSTASSAPPASSTTAAKAKGAATARRMPPAPAKAAPAAPATRLQPAPGPYPLRISGTSSVGGKAAAVPATGSLVVESRSGDQQHRTVGVPGGLVLVQRAHAAGADVVSFSLTAGSRTLSFTPPAPLPFVRTEPGSWAWSVRSNDGTVTLSQTTTVSPAGAVNVGGTQVPAVSVHREFSVTGAVQGTVRLTSTVSLVDRLPLVQHQVINVSAAALGGLVPTTVVSESTASLTSTSPR